MSFFVIGPDGTVGSTLAIDRFSAIITGVTTVTSNFDADAADDGAVAVSDGPFFCVSFRWIRFDPNRDTNVDGMIDR